MLNFVYPRAFEYFWSVKNVRKEILRKKDIRTQILRTQVLQAFKVLTMTDAKKILDFAAYAFNPARQVDFLYNKQGENYRMHKFIQNMYIPIWSNLSGIKVGQMEDKEQLRYVSDFARNTGVDPSNWKYPIRMGYYGNAGSYGAGFGSGYRAISNLYKSSTKRRRYYR